MVCHLQPLQLLLSIHPAGGGAVPLVGKVKGLVRPPDDHAPQIHPSGLCCQQRGKQNGNNSGHQAQAAYDPQTGFATGDLSGRRSLLLLPIIEGSRVITGKIEGPALGQLLPGRLLPLGVLPLPASQYVQNIQDGLRGQGILFRTVQVCPEQLLQLLCGHGVKAAVIWIPCGFGIAHCHDPLSFIVRSDVTER